MSLFIKAKNGNVVEVPDEDIDNIAKRALVQGHEVYTSDPRVKGGKAKRWDPDAPEADETEQSE